MCECVREREIESVCEREWCVCVCVFVRGGGEETDRQRHRESVWSRRWRELDVC